MPAPQSSTPDRKSLADGGSPFVLEEEHGWLRQIALGELRNPVLFWQKMEGLPRFKGEIPASAHDALEHLLPEKGLQYRVARRVAGLGSLGRMRLVALAECNGGKVAREAKALAPSVVYWARGASQTDLLYQVIINRAVRSLIPFVQMRGRWIVRRLSPHCCRIELSVLPKGTRRTAIVVGDGMGDCKHPPGQPFRGQTGSPAPQPFEAGMVVVSCEKHG